MDIKTACIFLEGQSKALTFYNGILGLWKVNDIDLDEFRWLTASTVGSVEIEFLQKSNVHPAAKTYHKAIYADGTSITPIDTNRNEIICPIFMSMNPH